MFLPNNTSENNEINIEHMDFSTVTDMVKFIYSGKVKDLADKSDLLLAAADKYDVKDLKSLCSNHLAANLSTDQVRQYLHLNIILKPESEVTKSRFKAERTWIDPIFFGN